jgi:lysozyme
MKGGSSEPPFSFPSSQEAYMARSVNTETLEHVKRWEGFRADAYPDPGSRDGKPVTIGYGQTRRNGRAIQMGERSH